MEVLGCENCFATMRATSIMVFHRRVGLWGEAMSAPLGLQIHILLGLRMRLSEADDLVFVQELFREEIVLRCGTPHSDVGKEDIEVGDYGLGAGCGDFHIHTYWWDMLATIGFSNWLAGRL